MNVSVLGFGGAEIGFEGAALATVERLLAEALDQGLNTIDTAECYVNSEELIGSAVGKRRQEFFLFTKCGHTDSTFAPAWSKTEIKGSLNRSLKRLKTDYVDLLQLHSCDQSILEKGEVVEALQEAQKSGKVRFIGYSGDSTDAHYASVLMFSIHCKQAFLFLTRNVWSSPSLLLARKYGSYSQASYRQRGLAFSHQARQ
jgi:Predicted oxidoreductases (related to aryl-alcohol dehydrogenases)